MFYKIPIASLEEFGDLYYFGDRYYKGHHPDRETREAWHRKKRDLKGKAYSGPDDDMQESPEILVNTESEAAQEKEPVRRGKALAMIADPEEVKKLYIEQGLSIGDLADFYHCTPNQVRAYLKHYDVRKQNPRAKTWPFTVEDIYKLYVEDGVSKKAIAEKYGVRQRQLEYFMETHKIRRKM